MGWAVVLLRPGRWFAVCLAAAALLSACSPAATPGALIGTWYSDDERFADRSLQIHPQWIRFMQGSQELGALRVSAVTQEGSSEGPIRFEIEGTDRDGQDTTLTLELHKRPAELLRLETQREPWRRQPRARAAGRSS
jgi:hypothetical protein